MVGVQPTSLNSAATSTCTVSLNQAAPVGASSVVLASNNARLTIPAAVNLPAGASSTNFSGLAQVVILLDSSILAATGSFRAPGQPAQPGDHVSIRVTALPRMP